MKIKNILAVLKNCDKDAPIVFDFCRLVPTTIDSWRSIYSEPAIGWELPSFATIPITVNSVIEKLEECISGKEYKGYKGGVFTYDGDNSLYVDNPSEGTDTKVVGVVEQDYYVILQTTAITI